MIPYLFILLTCAVLTQSLCTRQKLEVATSRYITTQSTGQISWLQIVLSSNATYTENFITLDITHNNTLTQAKTIDHIHTIVDTTSCATYSELIVTNITSPYMIGVQIRFDANGNNITSIDSVVTTTGDLFFSQYSPSHMLHQLFLEDWSTIPLEKRDSRATIQAAGDMYYDYFVNHTVPVPWGSPCTRQEGGALTANGDCRVGVPDVAAATTNRKYVVDEIVGVVSVLSNFGALGPDIHEFRVEGGKIVRIHSLTLCRPKFNCGLDMPVELGKPAVS